MRTGYCQIKQEALILLWRLSSTKRQVVFEGEQDNSHRTLCPTRWTVRAGAMQRILDNYESLQETMEISSHGFDGRASGILALMEKFKIFFGLKLPVLIFNIMEQLSVTLQGVDTNVEDFFKAVNITIQGLRKHRTDAMFKNFLTRSKMKLKLISVIHQYSLGNNVFLGD